MPSFACLRTFLPFRQGKVKITRVMPTVIHYICDSQGAQRSRHMSLITVSILQITHTCTHARAALLQSLPLCCTHICMAICGCVCVRVWECVSIVCTLHVNLYRLKSSYPVAVWRQSEDDFLLDLATCIELVVHFSSILPQHFAISFLFLVTKLKKNDLKYIYIYNILKKIKKDICNLPCLS